MIRHHPSDAVLEQGASGSLSPGAALVVATHAERCSACRSGLRELEARCGVALDGLPPSNLSDGALRRTVARLEDARPSDPEPAPPAAGALRASLPAGMAWPRSLLEAHTSRWRRLGVGVRWCRVRLPLHREANVFLVRAAPGRGLPRHGHLGVEMTQVLFGAFDDGVAPFAAGDFEQAGGGVRPRPVVSAVGECVCLVAVDGRTSFDGPLARLVGALLGV